MKTRSWIAILGLAAALACGSSNNNGSGGGSGGGTAGGSGGGSGGGIAGGSGGGSGGGIAGGSGGGTAGGAGGGSGTPGTSEVKGRVGPYAGLADAGAPQGEVTVYQISSSGTISAISSPAALDANGDYTATVDYTGNPPANIAVGFNAADAGPVDGGPGDAGTVLPNTITALALVAAPLAANGTVTAPPVNAQTGAQFDVEIWALQNNLWTSVDNDAALELFLTPTVTDWLSNSTSYYPDIDAAGAATVAALGARAAVLSAGSLADGGTSAVDGGVSTAFSDFLAAETAAQAQEDVALNAAASSNDVYAATIARATAEATAASSAGFTAGQLSLAAIAEGRAAEAGLTNASSAVKAALTIQAELVQVDAVEAADLAAVIALGGSVTVEADIETAHTNLYNSISASGGVAATIASDWSAYHSALSADFTATLDGVQSGGGAAMSSVMSGEANALSTLNSSVTSAGTNGAQVAAAFTAYQASVSAAVAANSTLGLFTAAEQQAVVTLIIDAQTPQ